MRALQALPASQSLIRKKTNIILCVNVQWRQREYFFLYMEVQLFLIDITVQHPDIYPVHHPVTSLTTKGEIRDPHTA